MATLREMENELFEEWEKQYSGNFAKDGAGCNYERSKPKLLFILKETNSTDKDGKKGNYIKDIRADYLDNGMVYRTDDYRKKGSPIVQTWNKIYSWAYILLNNDSSKCQAPSDKEKRKDIFQLISTINIKKTPGVSKAVESEIRNFANDDSNKKFLSRQIKLYSPDIIICCGKGLVFELLAKSLETKPEKCFSKEGCSVYKSYCCKGDGGLTYIIDFYHPAYFGKSDEFFEKIIFEISKDLKASIPTQDHIKS